MSQPTLMRLTALSINAAKRAGAIIRDVMQKGNLGIVEKGKDDLQTEADRSAQRCIIASLSLAFPTIKIIGEEGGSDLDVCKDWLVTQGDEDFLNRTCPEQWLDVNDNEFVVWVDPLDGTSEYTQGFLDHVTVLIGIAVRNSAVAGIIHQPYFKNPGGELGRTIWGLKGLGTGGFIPNEPPKETFIITTTRSHSNTIVQAALEALSPTEIIKVGGAGYKVLLLLEGRAHAYVFASPGCKKWDTCAPEAVLEAQGGKLTDILGYHYSYATDVDYPNKKGVIATVKSVSHSDVITKLKNLNM
ncbi:3'(2'),5'-bisphosphate nucleotidase 1 [Stomoxys calcitrans]|uniref:3'(2'),5'-bisphosphate nucleotidase 1 n=1 Tax=Stomoxys calcitrans TaxID=35570 RepID=A0A1I8P0S4_STOCA|nr:3'(2'),5'-bisphosphate nucleotidase 1 [Stomoxys calcitrans]